MNSKIKFFQSIRFKIALVLTLMLLLTLELVGAVFVRQLETQNLNTFKQQVTLPSYVNNSLASQLNRNNTRQANRRIQQILSEVNNSSISEVRVVDTKDEIRGTSNVNNQGIVGQRSEDTAIKNTILNGRAHTENIYDNNNRYYVSVVPLFTASGNNLVGAIYMRANLEGVYRTVNNISLIYVFAALLAIVLGVALSILISREITAPIEEMRQQTMRIARGDYSGQVQVNDNDELGQLAGAVNNLSVRVEESQEASESERRRLNSVLGHMSDGVIATNRNGYITIINQTALQMLNYDDDDDAIGQSIIDVLNIRSEYSIRQLVDEQQHILIDMGKGDKNSDGLILNAYFSPIQRESGFVSGLVCVLHDVTSQQKEERERKEFVSNVSHELRTPLTSVKSYVEALTDGAWKDEEVAPQFLKVVQDETDRMIRMINDLLSLSRMDSGTARLDLEYVNINELFNYILDRFDMIIKKEEEDGTVKKRYTIVRHIAKKDLWVEIDADKFTQVIDNIMNNAVKYSPDGGVITARLVETHNHVILSISDQGLGIPRKDLGHIFDRFFRVDKARSRKQGGTGLGLAISKEVVNMLGGQIWVDSVEGKGSTFYISLPYIQYEEGDEWDDAPETKE